MAGPLVRLGKDKFFNKPHLVTPLQLETIAEFLQHRSNGNYEAAIRYKDLSKSEGKSVEEIVLENRVGIIPISGTLTYESTGWEMLCGGTSYQGVLDTYDKLARLGAEVIVLDVDSPGGEAYGAFESARELRARADRDGIKLITYVDGLAASAGYALAISAHEVIANPQAEVGSVGVVVRLTNTNKAMEKDGIETTYVYAGDSKIPFTEDGEFSESFLSDLQEKVDILYNDFTSFVAEARSLSQDDVIATQAKTFLAAQAQDLGLVDSLLTREEFFEKLAQDREDDMPLNRNNGERLNMSKSPVEETPVVSAEEVNELKAKLEAMEAQLATEALEKQKLLEAAQAEKVASLVKKAEAWSNLDVDAKAYAEAALKGAVPVEMFDALVDSAGKQLEEKENYISTLKEQVESMGELGAEDTEEPMAEAEDDGAEKYLKSQGLIK